MPDAHEQLRALERQVEREWWWLTGALHATAPIYTARPNGDMRYLQEMQAQARTVERWRGEIAMPIAAMDKDCNGYACIVLW
jgi:hypothetical protein